jgi:hypothetical protein
LAAASEDQNVLTDAAEKLPGMIDSSDMDEIWLNAVRLAGRLKVLETIPSLQKAFSLGRLDIGRPAVMTFGTEVALGDDAVAKALAEIGDPSLPAVRGFLKSGDPKMRRRAVLILMNINSSASRSLLQEHYPNENDPKISKLIQQWQDNSHQ